MEHRSVSTVLQCLDSNNVSSHLHWSLALIDRIMDGVVPEGSSGVEGRDGEPVMSSSYSSRSSVFYFFAAHVMRLPRNY